MDTTTFDNSVYFNGYQFVTYNDLANFLIENYANAINLIKDNTLFDIIKEGSISLHDELQKSTEGFEYCENVVTFIIYRLSSSPVFITKHNRFNTTYDMALAMKRSFPDLNNDVLTLLKDNVLSKIYWDEYLFTNDVRHKRNHDFLINVEANIKYLFSYYYFLVLHLPSTEKINFIVNNVKFEKIDELISYLYTNQKSIQQVIAEIKRNDLVLGLIASKTTINNVAHALSTGSYIDFLYLINTINQNNDAQTYDFSAVLNVKMCVWLSNNFQNYSYNTTRAKKLLKEYSIIVKKQDLSFLELFNQVKHLETLYLEFISIYKSDRIIKEESEIVADSDDFHLGYLHNDEVVCSRYLFDFDLIKSDIHSPDYILAQEKALVINRLDRVDNNLEKSNDLLENYYNTFSDERYNKVVFKNFIILSLLLFLVIGVLLLFLEQIGYVSIHEQFFTRVLGSIGIVLCLIVALVINSEYNRLSDIKKVKNKFKSYKKKLSKTKVLVTNLRYYKEAIITSEDEEDEEQEIDNSIVKERISIKFLKRYDKYNNTCLKISEKSVDKKSLELNFLSKLAIAVAFLPALILANHIIFNIIDLQLDYPFVEEFPVIYLIFTFINLVLISNKNAYRNTFIYFILSIVATVIINILL